MVALMKKTPTIGQVSLSALEDEWQRRATAAAIEAARAVVKFDGPIPPGTPVGRLNDTEWGWVLTAMRLIRMAMIARDLSDKGVSRGSSASTIARQANAAGGGPLMDPTELNDEIGI